MNLTTLIEDNIAIILTGFSILIGVSAVIFIFLATLFNQHFSRRLELQHKQLEWKKLYRDQELAAPIIRFIDEELRLMDAIYWPFVEEVLEEKKRQREEKDQEEIKDEEPYILDKLVLDKLVAHREEEGTIQARVASFKDDQLSTAFEAFSSSYGRFRQYIFEKKILEPRDEMKKAWEIAGTIFDRIGPQIPKH